MLNTKRINLLLHTLNTNSFNSYRNFIKDRSILLIKFVGVNLPKASSHNPITILQV